MGGRPLGRADHRRRGRAPRLPQFVALRAARGWYRPGQGVGGGRRSRAGRRGAGRVPRLDPGWRVMAGRWPGARRSRGPRRPGRDHLHLGRDRRSEGRRAHPPEHPRQHQPDRRRDRQVPEDRPPVFPASGPEPAPAEPHVRPDHGRLHSAAAARHGVLHEQLQPGGHRPRHPPVERDGARVRAADARRAPVVGRACGAVRHVAEPADASLAAALVAPRGRTPAFRPEVLVRGGRGGTAGPRSGGVLGAPRVSRHPGIRPHGDGARRGVEPPASRPPRVGWHAPAGRRREARGRRGDPRPGRQRDARVLQRSGRHRCGLRRRLVAHRRHRRTGRVRAPPRPRAHEGGHRRPRRHQRLPR